MSIQTSDFKTKSEILDKKMPRINGNNQYKGKTVVALDIGYSAVKGVSPNKLFIFPSYAKKTPKGLDVVGKVSSTDIQLRDNKTGDTWLVGHAAESLMDQSDVDSTTDASLYTRYRYGSDVFKVIASAGLALGLINTGSGNDIYLQTGLPATYKDRDESKLKNSLAGDYDISIKVGANAWQHLVFSLDTDHIDVMEQPQGTLCAAAYSKDGEVSAIGKDILKSNSIILDIGFGTEDIFSIRAGYKNNHNTYPDTGMRAVFDSVIKRLKDEYPAEYKIFEFQKYLESGQAPYFDQEEMRMDYVNFTGILEQENRALCEKSVRRLMQEYNNLIDYKYLIVTGGTGESRYEQIQEMLSGLPMLTILPGNVNDETVAFSYSNVIGYYMYRHARLAAEIKKNFA